MLEVREFVDVAMLSAIEAASLGSMASSYVSSELASFRMDIAKSSRGSRAYTYLGGLYPMLGWEDLCGVARSR